MNNLFKVVLLMLLVSGFAGGCGKDEPVAPVAKIQPETLSLHGHDRTDNYYWLNERENPEVLAYLEAENAYLDASIADLDGLRKTLFNEMKNRIVPDDSSAPYREKGFWYYTRYEKKGEYPLHCRRKGTMEAPEEVMLDGNRMADGEGYFALRGVKVSPDGRLVVYGTDTVGRRWYTLRVKNLETGEILEDVIPDVTANVTWAADSKTLFYGKKDPQTLRSYQIWRHELGTDPATDAMVYEEADDTYSCHVYRTKSDRFLIISSQQTLSSEIRILEADNPTGTFRVFQERQRNVEYHVYHQGDRFLILTNLHAPNFRLMECGLNETWLASWTEVESHRPDVLLEDVEVFTDWLTFTERSGGLTRLRVQSMKTGEDHYLEFDDPTYMAWSGKNPDMGSKILRIGYASMTTPQTTYEYDMFRRTRKLIKQQEVRGGFEPANYRSEYLLAPARDGALVPISLVYHKDFKPAGDRPLLLYGYGSYGASMDAGFRSSRLSLLDRGFVYAIAHIRGGQEMGRSWYEDGKLLNKKNTFQDFIDCGEFLVAKEYSAPDKLFAAGGSAGGLLIGAVVNMAPDLWKGALAAVPFVDVVTTMLDESIPLTTGEFDEWGNPQQKIYYDYMLSYSPYDQVEAKAYPALLVTTGLHDSQVQYFEPAKWVAKLRALKTDDSPLYFKINMEAGHGGKSGRYRRLEDTALGYAFFLDLAGLK